MDQMNSFKGWNINGKEIEVNEEVEKRKKSKDISIGLIQLNVVNNN